MFVTVCIPIRGQDTVVLDPFHMLQKDKRNEQI